MFNRYKSITTPLLVTLLFFSQSVTFYNKLIFISYCFINTYKISLKFVTFCNGLGVTFLLVYYQALRYTRNNCNACYSRKYFFIININPQKELLYIA